jgi:cell division transport system ATP-binding protein
MIYFDHVSKIYKNGAESVALDDITLSIAPEEFVSIVGHSGAGKSTFVKMILAEEVPTSGSIFYESVDINRLPRNKLPAYRRKIGTVFQDIRLLPHKTAFENIAFAMEAAGKSEEEIAADVPHALDLVDLADKAMNFPGELSGGERQRVAIARAIVNQPDVLVADEPTGHLDPINTFEIIQILRKINELGTTVILTTHNKGVIDSLGRRVITMDSGRIVRDDKEGRYIL